MTAHLLRRGAAGAVAATMLLATPAFAHPFFDPDEVPVDSLATVTLDLAHGCDAGDHEEGDEVDGDTEAPTREVAIEVPEAARFVDPEHLDGWELTVEGGDGEPEVLVYTAEDGTDVPAPQFDFDVVLTGEAGDEVYWRVVQACDDATHRWVGTPDEPAEDPAIVLTLTEPDEDAPPPEEADEAGTVTVVEDDEEEPAAPEEPADEAEDDEPVTDELDFEATDDEDAGMPGWILIVVLVATLVVAGVVLSMKGRDEGEDDASNGGASGGGGAGTS